MSLMRPTTVSGKLLQNLPNASSKTISARCRRLTIARGRRLTSTVGVSTSEEEVQIPLEEAAEEEEEEEAEAFPVRFLRLRPLGIRDR